MVITTMLIVLLRYGFNLGAIYMQESLVWFHSAIFLLGSAYTLQQNEHVRVDILYRSFSQQKQDWINTIGILIFVFPVCTYFVIVSWGFVYASWSVNEISRDAGGLPYPAIPILKSMLIMMPITLILQSLSILIKTKISRT
ncbi:TRAP transporter small permease subunit [Woeseiaceae bacterium]|jgi:TRAP-type mannitol/chloroaromatic compound transport system permease small subunit|nr:TRAP transporter small permease subunit [Woeseiaceae bacterium]MDB2543811.1 TRAP transporter small permease subunit [Woeseiaceae bacterium]